jgi:hypothetical protein
LIFHNFCDLIKTDPEHESTSQDAPVPSQFPESDEPSEDVFMDPLQVAIFGKRKTGFLKRAIKNFEM